MSKISLTQDKIRGQLPLRVLFINDVGFQYGAGIALLRQVQSFLLMGHDVGVLSWEQGLVESQIPVQPSNGTGSWLGLKALLKAEHTKLENANLNSAETLLTEVKQFHPDVVIVGNLHSSGWSTNILAELKKLNYLVIAYMHDCYLTTGRCAYPGTCTLFELGCDERCPTWQEYPALEPHLIKDAWLGKQQLFNGNGYAIPIATNSLWTLEFANKSLKQPFSLNCIYLGLDHYLFKPFSKKLARELLGIPHDAFVILSGAVNIADLRKGGGYIEKIVNTLSDQVYFIFFGVNSDNLKLSQGRFTGYNRDYRKMPILYNAADLFLGTSIEESFGQTFCEASACGTPIVAFRAGGIPEIARHQQNALLADEFTSEALIEQIRIILRNPNLAQSLGDMGRKIVEDEFTLAKQGSRWIDYLSKLG